MTAEPEQLDPVLLAYEAEQAWEAYRQTLQTLQVTQNLLHDRERSRGPTLSSFERIATIVWGWQMDKARGAADADAAMEAITAEIKRVRRESGGD